MTDQQQQKLLHLLDQINTATQQAHGLLKDLRAERAEIQTWLDTVRTSWRAETEQKVIEAVKDGLGKFERQTRKAMDAAVDKVFAEFDRIQAIITGRGENEPLDATAARVRAAADNMLYRPPNPDAIPIALRQVPPAGAR